MLQPKRTKFRKAHKGRIHGLAKGGTKLNFGHCFMLRGNENNKVSFAPVFKENAFGHAGIGGSVAFGDSKNKIGYAFVCNRQQKSSELYKTSNLLTEELYKIINN